MVQNFIASKPNASRNIIIAVCALAAVLLYLLASALIFRVGFPLDDTWIHLTYARNFAEHGEWAFRLGERSAGSTAPLWTFLLSLGYFLNLAPYAWTFFLGWVALTVLAIFAESYARKFVPVYTTSLPWVGIMFVFFWQFTWSATSGMETLTHGVVLFAVLLMLMDGSRRYLTLGLLTGLSVWVRPDGLTLLGPIFFTIFFIEETWQARGKAALLVLIGFGALFLPYLLFNLALAGTPMPNTFYAKQAEYAEFWLSKPFSQRLSEYLLQMLASPLIVLFPGMLLWLGKAIRSRNWGMLAGVIWFVGYVAIYFMKLPAYQHGRYFIPALPVLYFWSVVGFLGFICAPNINRQVVFLWQSLVGVLCVMFTYVGANQNAADVYWIESQMVETAKWVQTNVPSDAVLAVHDIGALGYYVSNPIIDLAGLITPTVVPFIRDEVRLEQFLAETSSDYLIVFRGTYPQLTAGRIPVYTAGQEPGTLKFDDNMVVFPLK